MRKRRLKRPSLYVIKGILESVDKGSSHKARFCEIAGFTPELRNRKTMLAYLELLVEELQWLNKTEEIEESRSNPVTSSHPYKTWKVFRYSVTNLGRTFLGLFPPTPTNEEEDDDGVPSPEEQERNWREWLGQSVDEN